MHHHHVNPGTHRMLENPPKYMGSATRIAAMEGLKIAVVQDGLHTLAQVDYSGYPVATGHAKRKITDQPDPELGTAIALSRMFAEAARIYAEKVEHLMLHSREPEQSIEEILGLAAPDAQDGSAKAREHYRLQARKDKNDRRRQARKAWYLKNNEGADDLEISAWLGRTFQDWG